MTLMKLRKLFASCLLKILQRPKQTHALIMNAWWSIYCFHLFRRILVETTGRSPDVVGWASPGESLIDDVHSWCYLLMMWWLQDIVQTCHHWTIVQRHHWTINTATIMIGLCGVFVGLWYMVHFHNGDCLPQCAQSPLWDVRSMILGISTHRWLVWLLGSPMAQPFLPRFWFAPTISWRRWNWKTQVVVAKWNWRRWMFGASAGQWMCQKKSLGVDARKWDCTVLHDTTWVQALQRKFVMKKMWVFKFFITGITGIRPYQATKLAPRSARAPGPGPGPSSVAWPCRSSWRPWQIRRSHWQCSQTRRSIHLWISIALLLLEIMGLHLPRSLVKLHKWLRMWFQPRRKWLSFGRALRVLQWSSMWRRRSSDIPAIPAARLMAFIACAWTRMNWWPR